MSSEQKIEQILVDLGLTGPRITPVMIDELMREVTYSTHVVPGTTTTVATAIDGAGFTLCTVSSACASPENFNPALGIEIAITKARAAAREELWKLEGYRLKRALHDARSTNSTKALEQIRTVLAKPSADRWAPRRPSGCALGCSTPCASLPGCPPVAPGEAVAAQPAASPLLAAAQELAVEVSVTAELLAAGTAVRRQLASALATPGRGA